jgi:hypothetical protein
MWDAGQEAAGAEEGLLQGSILIVIKLNSENTIHLFPEYLLRLQYIEALSQKEQTLHLENLWSQGPSQRQ